MPFDKQEGGKCSSCNEGKYVKSPKTGKIFCDKKCWLTGQAFQQPETKEKPDWDAISRGKVRHGVVCAMIEAKWSKEEVKSELSFYVDLIMKDDKPKGEEVAIDVEDIPFSG